MVTQSIVMLCSLDTKAPEAQYLQECIEGQGATPIMIDIGYGQPAKMAATIGARKLAEAAGSDIDTIRAMRSTDEASTLMVKGAIIKVQELFHEGRCDGIISFGGASNTTLATSVMKTLPVGIPKLMISSSAAIPAYSAMYFGSMDITIMHSVVDISGLNDLTRAFLKRGAGGICGMAAADKGSIDPSRETRLIAVTSYRFAEACSQFVMRGLERHGYTAIPFHAQGVGEDAMENLIAQGLFLGVVDIVPAGLSEHMMGGNRAARASCLEAAGKIGIPQVVGTSGFDMISCGPINRRDSGDPLWEQRAIAERQISIPDKFRVEARTNAKELVEIAQMVAIKLNKSESPVSVVVPVQGWSSLSVKGTDLHNPELDAIFVPALRKDLNSDIAIHEIDAEINSEQYAVALVTELLALLNP